MRNEHGSDIIFPDIFHNYDPVSQCMPAGLRPGGCISEDLNTSHKMLEKSPERSEQEKRYCSKKSMLSHTECICHIRICLARWYLLTFQFIAAMWEIMTPTTCPAWIHESWIELKLRANKSLRKGWVVGRLSFFTTRQTLRARGQKVLMLEFRLQVMAHITIGSVCMTKVTWWTGCTVTRSVTGSRWAATRTRWGTRQTSTSASLDNRPCTFPSAYVQTQRQTL